MPNKTHTRASARQHRAHAHERACSITCFWSQPWRSWGRRLLAVVCCRRRCGIPIETENVQSDGLRQQYKHTCSHADTHTHTWRTCACVCSFSDQVHMANAILCAVSDRNGQRTHTFRVFRVLCCLKRRARVSRKTPHHTAVYGQTDDRLCVPPLMRFVGQIEYV